MIIKILKLVYDLIPSISLLLLLTEKLENQKKYDQAIELLNARIISGEESYKFYDLKFRINYLNEQNGKNSEALIGYLELLRLTETRKLKKEVLTSNIIELYNKLKRPDDAISLYKQYVSENTNSMNKEICFNIGNSYLAIKLLDEAIDHYSRSISMGNNKNPHLLFNLGLAYYDKNNYQESEITFRKALKNVETDFFKGEIYYSLGVLYARTQDFKNAEQSFILALELGYEEAAEGLKEINNNTNT